MDDRLRRAGIGELRELLGSRQLSAAELLTQTLALLDAREPELHAFVTVDRRGSTAQAARADRRIAELGTAAWDDAPLLGLPVSVKDLTPTAGLRTTRGSLLHRDWVPAADAPAVARLRTAGAVIVGKTTTSEGGWSAATSNRLTPATANPWRPGLSSGGSSGGAAAAVAAGIGAAATGTDGAGSIRIPAAFCGVVGLKPTFGRVPYTPLSPERLSHIGPLTRRVSDAALLLDVMSGPDPADPYSLGLPACAGVPAARARTDRHVRVGWLRPAGPVTARPDIERRARAAVEGLSARGHVVEDLGTPFADPYPALVTILAADAATQPVADDPSSDPARLPIVAHGRRLGAADLVRAEAERARLTSALGRLMERHDLLAMPTAPVEPFAVDAWRPDADGGADALEWLHWCSAAYPFNLTGQPAVSVPAGLTDSGLPVGLQLVGRWHEDHLVLAAAGWIEEALPWRAPPAGRHQ